MLLTPWFSPPTPPLSFLCLINSFRGEYVFSVHNQSNESNRSNRANTFNTFNTYNTSNTLTHFPYVQFTHILYAIFLPDTVAFASTKWNKIYTSIPKYTKEYQTVPEYRKHMYKLCQNIQDAWYLQDSKKKQVAWLAGRGAGYFVVYCKNKKREE